MSQPSIFGIYGYSDTGKTTLIVNLVEHLTKEGYIVASIKKTKKSISLDVEGKDTWRHHSAGADLVVFSSANQTDFLLNKTMSTSDIVGKIVVMGRYDVILVEGADDPNIPKIQVGTGRKRKNTIVCYNNNFKEILKIIKNELKMKQSLQRLFVRVNGKNIPLTKFPEQIFTNTIVGMLRSLKDLQKINDFTILLKK